MLIVRSCVRSADYATVHHGSFFSPTAEKGQPYWSLGFLFDRDIAYISDVSFIPEATWKLLVPDPQLEDLQINGAATTSEKNKSPPVLIIDALKIAPHASHFGIGQAVATAVRLKAQRTYLTGFAHRVTHDGWEYMAEQLSAQKYSIRSGPPAFPQGHAGSFDFERRLHHRVEENFKELAEVAMQETKGWVSVDEENGQQYWVRPAFDGLTLGVTAEGKAWDEYYSSTERGL